MSETRVTDAMIFGAAVGWEMAHTEMCARAELCSAHQPIEADARRPWLVARLAAYLAAADIQAAAEPRPQAAGAEDDGGAG
jgi:hypothetical protein